MAKEMRPILKTCRSLDISPAYLGIFKESNRNKGTGGRPKKLSEYALQLREKQRVRFVYGVLEKQFARSFEKARKMEGLAGENLLILMELRLDNVVFRMNIVESRRLARQIVTHGHIRVNGKKVDIPSYTVKPGDVISIRESSRKSNVFEGMSERSKYIRPEWVSFDFENMTGKIERMPLRSDIDLPINESLIVEYYSK